MPHKSGYKMPHMKEEKSERDATSVIPHVPMTGPNPHRELRRGPEGRTIMDSVDRMQRGK